MTSDRTRARVLPRLVPIGVLVLTMAIAIVVAIVTGDPGLGLLVVILAVTGFSFALHIRQTRSIHRKIDQVRSELSETQSNLHRAMESDGSARSVELAGLSASVLRSRRLQAKNAAELSGQVAQIAVRVQELAAAVEDHGARLLPVVEQAAALVPSGADLTSTPPKSPPPPARFSAVSGDHMVAGLQLDGAAPRVNLVLNSFSSSQTFAGVSTALWAATRAASRLGRPLRIVLLREPDETAAQTALRVAELIEADAGGHGLATDLQISRPSAPVRTGFHPDDFWIATYWTTAVAIQQAVDGGAVQADKVLYLVQDWEPGFMPWGGPHVLAVNTYTAGFRLVVNSTPLAAFLTQQAGINVSEQAVFGPRVDAGPLHEAAHRWTPGDPDRPRVLFYARPSKPRNLYPLGLDALRLWADQLPAGVRPEVTFAGEDLPAPDVGDRIDVVRAGKTDLAGYYDLLASTDVGLALMYSPHPSHLALELPMAGIPTVTNEFNTARVAWVEGLTVSPPTPAALSAALDEAWRGAIRLRRHTPAPAPALGGSLEDAVDFALDAMMGQSAGHSGPAT